MGERTKLKGFVAHWGWIYIVFQMAEFYRETRDNQYEKNIIQLYNDMAFMKDHEKWKSELLQEQIRQNANR